MYKITLAIRYMLKRKISYFAVLAVTLCVFVVLVVITVLSGLTEEFKKNAHLSTGDCVISSKSLVGFPYYDEFIKSLQDQKEVEAVSPAIKNYALISAITDSNRLRLDNDTVQIIGIDPVQYSRVTGFGRWLNEHKNNIADAFKPAYKPDSPGCVPGINFLFERDSNGQYIITEQTPKAAFEITCFPLTVKGALAKAGAGEVNTKTFYCSDFTQSGSSADWTCFYLSLDEAQILCGMDSELKRVNEIYIRFTPNTDLETGCNKIKSLWTLFLENKQNDKYAYLLDKVTVQSWKTYNRFFIAAIETERTMMIFVFAMIGIITVFIVFVVFYMIVSHKTKDIGILKSVGVSNWNVLILFQGFSFMIGLTGSCLGTLGGWQFLVNINRTEDFLFRHFGFQLWDRTMYAIGDIPNTLDIKVLGAIVMSAIIACLIGALIPSWHASRLQPTETLQVNQL